MQVHTEMLLTICREYAGLADARALSAQEIRFFYEGIRDDLKRASKKPK